MDISQKMQPPRDGKIKGFYSGIFPEVYIALRPFRKLDDNAPNDIWSGSYPPGELRQYLKPMKWQNVADLTGLSINSINQGLLTWSNAVKLKFQNRESREALEKLEDKFRVLIPQEDSFDDAELLKILTVVSDMGYSEILIDDEFGSHYQNAPRLCLTDLTIEKLDRPEETEGKVGGCRLQSAYTSDYKILLAAPYDCYFSLICSTRPILDQIVNQASLEGFMADDLTELFWGCGI